MTATTSVRMTESLSRDSPWRRPDIQGLRALAVLAVITFHAGLPLPGGFTGVDVFFVISGFVITGLILRNHEAKSFRFSKFYAKRAQRLLPALVLMVLTVYVASLLFQSPFGAQEVTAVTGVGAALLSANVVITRTLGGYFTSDAEANPLLHSWSLSVEEQFYLAFPFLLIVGLSLGVKQALKHSRLGAWIIVGTLTAVSFVIGVAWTYGWFTFDLTDQPETWAFFLSPSRAWEFGAGALLALLLARRTRSTSRRAMKLTVGVGLTLLLIAFFGISESTPFPGFAALIPVLGTVALISAGSQDNLISRGLASRPMVRVGDWSYSLYLWHWPVIVFAVLLWPTKWTPAVAAALSFIPAIASFYLLESPIRQAKLSGARVLRLSLVLSALVIIAGVLLWRVGDSLLPGVSALNEQRQVPTASQEADCFVEGHFRAEAIDDYSRACWFPADEAVGWILLAGDSHAAHASNAVINAAHKVNLSVFSLTGGACPFVRQRPAYSDVDNCEVLNRYLWSKVESSSPPQAVIMGSRGVPDGMSATLQELSAAKIPTIWLRTVPRWAPLEQGLQHLPCKGGIANFTCNFSRAEIDGYAGDTRAQEQTLLASFPETRVIDAEKIFCSKQNCSPIVEGVLRYVDNEHLNGSGSSLLTPLVSSALESLLVEHRPRMNALPLNSETKASQSQERNA